MRGISIYGYPVSRPLDRSARVDPLGVDIGRCRPPVFPGDQYSSGSVRIECDPAKLTGNGAYSHSIGRPEACPRRVDPLGIQIVIFDAVIRPYDEDSARFVRHDLRHVLPLRGGADGDSAGCPERRAVRVEPLAVNIAVEHSTSLVVPEDYRATASVGGDDRAVLVPGFVTDDYGARAPERRSQLVEPLGEDISHAAPCDDGAAFSVRHHLRVLLVVACRAVWFVPVPPQRLSCFRHSSRDDVPVAAQVIVPGDDGSSIPVTDYPGILEMSVMSNHSGPSVGPLLRPVRKDPLGVDITGCIPFVQPCDDRSARTIGHDHRTILIIALAADFEPRTPPQERSQVIDPLGIDIGLSTDDISPGQDGPTGTVGYDLYIRS